MKTRPIAMALAISIAMITSAACAQAPRTPSKPAQVVGHWTGGGSFFDAKLAKQLGALSFEVECRADGSGTGRVGNATLENLRVKTVRNHLEITANLKGKIGADPLLAKNYIVLLVSAVTDSTMQAEFHLKSNAAFDARMREGRVGLKRVKASNQTP